MNRPKLWTKDFIIVSSINFLISLIFYLLVVTIAVYAVDEYNASTSEAGLVTGIFIIGALIGRIFIGRYLDVIGRMRTLYIGLLFFTLAVVLYFVNIGLTFLLINRLIHGIALGVASTATGTLVTQAIPVSRRGEGIGYYSMSATLATAIGPFIGMFMSQHTSFRMIFAFCLVLGIISLLIAFLIRIPPVEIPAQTAEAGGFKWTNFVEPKALPIAIITLALAFCYSSVLSFITFYAIEIDLVEAAGFFFLVYAIAVLVSRPFSGRLLDLKGANFVMYPAFLLFAAGMLLLSTAQSGIILLVAGALIGLGFGNMQSSTQAIAVKLTPAHRMGLATSTFFIFLDAGFGFGPYLLGFLISATGYSTMYVVLSIVVVATAVLYYFLHGRKDRLLNEPLS
ncbi:MFS transporter [Sporosarcina sp. ACRSM]|uniref:MFS transporter n=1 Tax=Sporosarcina sp. ACRSM TaxID=2918216 RepID=UPI001EF53ABD|nr:MFS transporter [Sporosarcina sp. ACRSM]MCG7334590.1 MFS transporter [Sporosarcina sp. ACRSM]